MIELKPLRDQAIEAGWLAYESRCKGMRDAYLKACESWTIEAVCSGDEVIGALYSKDGVIHLGIVEAWRGRWASRRLIREMLKRGTKTEVTDDDPIDFLRRIRGIA